MCVPIWYLYASWLNLIFLGWKLKYLIIYNCIIFYVYCYWKLDIKLYLFCKPFVSPHHYGITSITVESLCILVMGGGKTFNREKSIFLFNKTTSDIYMFCHHHITLLSSHLCWVHVYVEAYYNNNNNNNNINIFVECNVKAIFT